MRELQQQTMKVLWGQLSDTRGEVRSLQTARRQRAALALQRYWRGYRARKVGEARWRDFWANHQIPLPPRCTARRWRRG